METIRVLIADDHLFFREGVRVLLDSVPETEVVGEASTGDEVIAKAATLQPDVILMDLHMPGPMALRRPVISCAPAHTSVFWSSRCMKMITQCSRPCVQEHVAIS